VSGGKNTDNPAAFKWWSLWQRSLPLEGERTPWYWRLALGRRPDFMIGGFEDPYMVRWYVVPRNPVLNVYLHYFLQSDRDEELHDHPWLFNASYILEGEYTELTIPRGGVRQRKIYRAGNFKPRIGAAPHRVELHAGSCWSLFITGPVVREWGFHCPDRWVPFKEFLASRSRVPPSEQDKP
jgi:hypothetical protein